MLQKFLRIAIFIENLWWMVLDISARISEASAKISYTEICKVIWKKWITCFLLDITFRIKLIKVFPNILFYEDVTEL